MSLPESNGSPAHHSSVGYLTELNGQSYDDPTKRLIVPDAVDPIGPAHAGEISVTVSSPSDASAAGAAQSTAVDIPGAANAPDDGSKLLKDLEAALASPIAALPVAANSVSTETRESEPQIIRSDLAGLFAPTIKKTNTSLGKSPDPSELPGPQTERLLMFSIAAPPATAHVPAPVAENRAARESERTSAAALSSQVAARSGPTVPAPAKSAPLLVPPEPIAVPTSVTTLKNSMAFRMSLSTERQPALETPARPSSPASSGSSGTQAEAKIAPDTPTAVSANIKPSSTFGSTPGLASPTVLVPPRVRQDASAAFEMTAQSEPKSKSVWPAPPAKPSPDRHVSVLVSQLNPAKHFSATARSIAAAAAIFCAGLGAGLLLDGRGESSTAEPSGTMETTWSELLAAGPTSPKGVVAKDIDPHQAFKLADTTLHSGGQSDPDEARFWLRTGIAGILTDKRLPWALTQLGTLYAHPNAKAAELVKARAVWELAAAQNDPVALCFLAALEEQGLLNPTDKPRALRLYQRAKAAGGCADADKAIQRLGK